MRIDSRRAPIANQGPGIVAQRPFSCCGRKKCPVGTELADGSFVLAEPDLPGAPAVPLTREQAAELRDWLAERLSR